jgi:hypothetical protein
MPASAGEVAAQVDAFRALADATPRALLTQAEAMGDRGGLGAAADIELGQDP